MRLTLAKIRAEFSQAAAESQGEKIGAWIQQGRVSGFASNEKVLNCHASISP